MPKEISEHEKKLLEMQIGMRHNQQNMEECFKDLDNWTSEIKVTEKKVLENPGSIKSANKGLPPIRSLATTKKKKKVKKITNEKEQNNETNKKSMAPRDARSWDKLDVDKMCEEVDTHKSSESEYTTDEEWEEEQKKVRANWEKERGNQFFKDNMLNEAINCYTSAMDLEPDNCVYSANRAMCLIKQEKYAAAVSDCTLSLSINSNYVKALHRRSTCQTKLSKFKEAKLDLEALLKIEPNNRLAQTELNQVLQLIDTRQLVFPVIKKEEDKSKKELKRILIEEINDDSSERADMEKKQVEINKRVQLNSHEEKLFKVKDNKKETKITEISEEVEKINVKKLIDPLTEISNKFEEKVKRPIEIKRTIPDAPTNGYQFKKDWQLLNSNLEDLTNYFMKVPPKQYKVLFMNGLESDYLSKILMIFKNKFFNDIEQLFLHMKCLAEVKRFKTQLMFLSSADTKVIKELLEILKTSSNILKTDLQELIKNYSD